MATIIDIGRRAGVSRTTVSRALHTGGYVSKGARQKVFAAAEELQYRPNSIARGLVSQKTGNIGFVLCDRSLSHPFYYRILESVEKELGSKGYRVIFSSAEEFLFEKRKFPNILKEKVLDGVLLTGKIDVKLISIQREDKVNGVWSTLPVEVLETSGEVR